VVWTGLIGHAFLDAYEALGDRRDADVATGACELILEELGWTEQPGGVCLRYYPGTDIVVHNANMIGASLLARVAALSGHDRCRDVAERAVRFTVRHQTADGAWYYGVGSAWRWIDSFHTGYVLDALDLFRRAQNSEEHGEALRRGYEYFLRTFFAADGTPRYYHTKTRPLDIQCAAQGIQTLVTLRAWHPRSLDVALRVARWTIAHMQSPAGHFYYRRYPGMVNATPTLHWGQATMFAALAALDRCLHATAPARAAAR
jgi:hypothetical protein